MRVLVACLALTFLGPALAVQIGDTREAVRAELGKPESVMTVGSREVYLYPAGRLSLTDGKVSEIRGAFTAPKVPAPTPRTPPAAPLDDPELAPPQPAPTPTAVRPRTAHWYTNLAEAQAAATREHKLILALFTGTDWCGPCQQFQAEVAHDEQFAGIFGGSFVFFKNDWLRNTPQPDAIKAEVGRVRRKYLVTAYPTLLVLNAEGDRLDKVAWTDMQEGSFKERMIEAIDLSRKATKGGRKVSGGWWPF